MSTIIESDLVSYDPLSEVTRKERRALLGVSLLGLALVKVPLVPTKLSTLGVEFAQVNQKTFVLLYALVVVYFVFAFLIYGLTDLVAWARIEKIRYSAYTKANEANAPPPKPKFPGGYAKVTLERKEIPPALRRRQSRLQGYCLLSSCDVRIANTSCLRVRRPHRVRKLCAC